MSIHYKNGSGLEEFASKVEFDDHTGVLTINGEQHQTLKAEVVDQLPENPDLSTFYFVTYDGGVEPTPEAYLTKAQADQYYQAINTCLPTSLSTNESADIESGEALLPTAKAIKEYVEHAIAISAAYLVVNSMYPVGSIYMSISSDLPPELTVGGMTWEPINGGQGFWIVNSDDSDLGKHVDGVLPKHTHTYTGATNSNVFAPGVYPGARASSSTSTGIGSISHGVSGVSMGDTLRQPSFCIRAWRRTE